ncbi:MAG: hypothetical protein QOK10_3069 [Pseudonocardiales bacterium]|nr:hypothetical protein [Pseudonocardiales bacterium]
MRRFTPLGPDRLAAELSRLALERHGEQHPLRIALDGPEFVDLTALAEAIRGDLILAGHPAALLDTAGFYRDASLRFEYGKTDLESFYSGWLDKTGLQREVLAPLGPAGEGSYLASLRDPATNRSTRAARAVLPPDGVLLVTGALLLGIGLSFDLTVHLSVSRQARRRLAPASLAWTLPAYDRYDLDVDPSGAADVVIRYDDPQRPAIAVNSAN